MTLFEEDGYTEYIKINGQKTKVLQPKRAYKLVIKSTAADGVELYEGGNYPSFPIVPLYANDYHQSELVGLRENIDAYDLIKSGFANDMDGHLLYWLIQNAGGMDDVDIARVLERIKTMGAAIASDEGTIEQHQIDIPYESRIAYLDRIEQDLYKDFGALKVENISSGATTATQIKSAYAPQDMKTTMFEYMCIEFVQSILRLQGIDATPQFKRDKIANYQDETVMLLQSANYLNEETILKHLPFLSPDEINDIMKAKEKEKEKGYEMAEAIRTGNGAAIPEIANKEESENEEEQEQENNNEDEQEQNNTEEEKQDEETDDNEDKDNKDEEKKKKKK